MTYYLTNDKLFCHTYPYVYYMVYGDNEGECFLRKERPENEGGYFIPLGRDSLYSKYIIDYTKDNVLYAAVAHEEDHGFEVEFHGKKTTFGMLSAKIYKYVGEYIHPDFENGLVEIGSTQIDQLIEKDAIVVLGCHGIQHPSFKRVSKIDLNVKSIFLSGGIGDIFAIDCLLSDEIKKNIEVVYYSTKQVAVIQELLKAVPEYKNVKKHIVICNDFDKIPSFIYKSECSLTDEDFLQSSDFGIFTLFSQFFSGHLHYNKSSWLSHTLCEIKFDLPEEYVVICPYSINWWLNADGSISKDLDRNFSDVDWKETLIFLEKKNIKGIVLNGPGFHDPVPNHPNLIDFSCKTSILESIEILKKAKYYIGIAGCLSVLAANLLPVDCMAMKLVSPYAIIWKRAYWSSHLEFPFLKNIIKTDHLT